MHLLSSPRWTYQMFLPPKWTFQRKLLLAARSSSRTEVRGWASAAESSSGILFELQMLALQAVSSNSSCELPLLTIFPDSIGMLLKLLSNFGHLHPILRTLTSRGIFFSPQQREERIFRHIFLSFSVEMKTDIDLHLCKAIYLKQIQKDFAKCR